MMSCASWQTEAMLWLLLLLLLLLRLTPTKQGRRGLLLRAASVDIGDESWVAR